MLKVFLSIVGGLAALLAAVFAADRSLRTVRKYHRRYIEVGRKSDTYSE